MNRRIEISIIEEGQARWLAFLNGELDTIDAPGIPSEFVEGPACGVTPELENDLPGNRRQQQDGGPQVVMDHQSIVEQTGVQSLRSNQPPDFRRRLIGLPTVPWRHQPSTKLK